MVGVNCRSVYTSPWRRKFLWHEKVMGHTKAIAECYESMEHDAKHRQHRSTRGRRRGEEQPRTRTRNTTTNTMPRRPSNTSELKENKNDMTAQLAPSESKQMRPLTWEHTNEHAHKSTHMGMRKCEATRMRDHGIDANLWMSTRRGLMKKNFYQNSSRLGICWLTLDSMHKRGT